MQDCLLPRAAVPSEAEAPASYESITAGGVQVFCHDGAIPGWVGPALASRYSSLFSSLPQLEAAGPLHGVSTYAARSEGQLLDLWLYRLRGKTVEVLNEGIAVDAGALERFAQTMFARHPQAAVLRLNAVYPQLQGCRLAYRRYLYSDDTVLRLPASIEAWLASLGRQTRKNLRRYLARWHQEHPSASYEIIEGEAIAARDLHAVVAFNRARMQAKGKLCGIGPEEERRMLALARRCGMLALLKLDGRICAGAVVYQVGEECYSWLRAHDPAYDDQRLGLVGAYLLVEACIRRGARALHFMWGREPHKQLLGGELRESETLLVFRSRAAAVRTLGVLLPLELEAARRRLRRVLLARADGSGVVATALRLARAAVRRLRGRGAEGPPEAV